LFDGKPLFYWILNTLRDSLRVEGIYVDTDSDELADAVKAFFKDVRIILRPSYLCGDDVSMNKIIDHDIEEITGSDYFLQTHTTNPLLTPGTVDSAIETFFSGKRQYDSLFSVSRIQTRCYCHDGTGINHNPDELIPTQKLPPVYVENSNIYLFSRTSFNVRKRRIGIRPYMFEMSQYEAFDIDEEDDFLYAEIFHKARRTV
jgi:CMP-N-acetylneuraminic acid synthetase